MNLLCNTDAKIHIILLFQYYKPHFVYKNLYLYLQVFQNHNLKPKNNLHPLSTSNFNLKNHFPTPQNTNFKMKFVFPTQWKPNSKLKCHFHTERKSFLKKISSFRTRRKSARELTNYLLTPKMWRLWEVIWKSTPSDWGNSTMPSTLTLWTARWTKP